MIRNDTIRYDTIDYRKCLARAEKPTDSHFNLAKTEKISKNRLSHRINFIVTTSGKS